MIFMCNIADEMSSLCMNCMENGMTKFFFTKIPFFKGKYINNNNSIWIY